MNPPEKLLTADNSSLHQRAKAMRQGMSEAEAKRHARCGLGLQGKWRTRACVRTAHTLHVGYGFLGFAVD